MRKLRKDLVEIENIKNAITFNQEYMFYGVRLYKYESSDGLLVIKWYDNNGKNLLRVETRFNVGVDSDRTDTYITQAPFGDFRDFILEQVLLEKNDLEREEKTYLESIKFNNYSLDDFRNYILEE